MAIMLVVVLYFAWLITWSGTFATTCAMGDAESLSGAMIASSVFYLGSIFALPLLRLNVAGVFLSLPLVPLMTWQAIWGVKLFFVVNISGRSACDLMFGEGYGPSGGGWHELACAPYYVLVSLSAILALAASHWRYRQNRKPRVPLDAFD